MVSENETPTEKRKHVKKAPPLEVTKVDAAAGVVTFAEPAAERLTVRFIRGVPLNPTMAKPVESYTGEIVQTNRGVLIVEHGARVPWSNVAVIHLPGLSEREIRNGPSTQDEERGLKDRLR